ncbi:MAG: hypothetical protein ABIV39_02495, partial [Verrucomicrobiota bacterium]
MLRPLLGSVVSLRFSTSLNGCGIGALLRFRLLLCFELVRPFNILQIGLTGLLQTGFRFTPPRRLVRLILPF